MHFAQYFSSFRLLKIPPPPLIFSGHQLHMRTKKSKRKTWRCRFQRIALRTLLRSLCARSCGRVRGARGGAGSAHWERTGRAALRCSVDIGSSVLPEEVMAEDSVKARGHRGLSDGNYAFSCVIVWNISSTQKLGWVSITLIRLILKRKQLCRRFARLEVYGLICFFFICVTAFYLFKATHSFDITEK